MTTINVYIRMRKMIHKSKLDEIKLKEIAYISTVFDKKNELEEIPIYRITKKDNNIVVIDSFTVIKHLNELYNRLDFQVVGPPHTIVRVVNKQQRSSLIIASFVWILLFIGTAMTIMNFHYDVSMQEVHQRLHYLLTSEETPFPLWIQIPYSIGLGVGMLLFFNHWFKKRFNEEPSPLEVELFNYQQNIDQYIGHYENDLNDKHKYY
ncbi:stage V sporulation protein AA [Virgibacillus sp. W0430]|uniref:stage V sporulation protein AA n=1 Tax=Virgibacillus sp. W0430 TaxID=3391580 RepID=UPI003F4902B3